MNLFKTITTILIFIIIHNISAQVDVSLPDTTQKFNKSIKIPIVVSELNFFGIRSYTFHLNYDNSILKSNKVISKGTLSDRKSWDVSVKYDDYGLTISASGRYALTGSGNLLEIEFIVIAEQGATDLILDHFIFNNGFPSPNITNGKFNVYSEILIGFSKQGNGEGNISLNGEEYVLPFSKLLVQGMSYSLQANPENNSNFLYWAGGVQSLENPLEFEAKTEVEIITNFELKTFSVTASINPDGFGNVIGIGIYRYGDIAILNANPYEGKEFVNWTIDGNEVNNELNFQFNVYNDLEVAANFRNRLFQITATTNPVEAGQIVGAGYYYYNQLANIGTICNENWHFLNWSENSEIISVDSLLSFGVTQDRYLTANFELITNLESELSNYKTMPNNYISNPYPNPFNPSTLFRFGIKNNSQVTLYILDVTGKIVARLFNYSEIPRGVYESRFDASNLPSGVYFYHFQIIDYTSRNRFKKNGKILLVK